MRIKAVIHRIPDSEGGDYWTEVPALPGCMTQGETHEKFMRNIQEAVEGWLSIQAQPQAAYESSEVVEIIA
jgi:predicted RNase H-like HicB family nuclease